ncbi:MAG TPA: hypothetical protein P5114_04990 [Hyphomicrobiaceae bacterium]|nr:hypothetical protein [Hyphomicrobiaceae bacterium]
MTLDIASMSASIPERTRRGLICRIFHESLDGHIRVLLGMMAVATLASGALAQETKSCSGNPVMARGEASSFEWLAKTKARANWRHRVRSTPELGALYADWKLAANLEESCLVGPEGTVCTITAVPCRN